MSLWVHDPSHSVSPELVLNWVQNLCACADCPLHDLVHIADVNKDSNRRAAIKLRRAREETRPFRFDHNHFTADAHQSMRHLSTRTGTAGQCECAKGLAPEFHSRGRISAR